MAELVTIIIPCRNEEKFIGPCLESIFQQDYSQDHLEVLVADGMSTDKTVEILQAYVERYSHLHWFRNPRKIVPAGLNILIARAKGGVIMRMDAHADYPKDYITKCVRYLEEPGIDNVGGVCITLPESPKPAAEAIAFALASSFGVGNSLFRTGGITAPILADTVPFGCYRREVFNRIGLFDEDLVRNQDDEFNSRLIKNGGKILLVPDIVTKYYARGSYFNLWRMYYQYGYFKPLTVLKLGGVMTWRQLVPAVFIGSMAFLVVLSFFNPAFQRLFLLEISAYFLTNMAVSFWLGLRNYFFLFPLISAAFVVIHFGYGLGYIKGILDFIFLKRHVKTKIKDMAISR